MSASGPDPLNESRRRVRPAWIARLLSDGVVRATGVLVGGTALAHGLTALAMPISTRLYSPSDFTVAAGFSSILAILITGACLRLDVAIALPDDDEEAANLLALSSLFAVLVAGLTAIVTIVVPAGIWTALGQEALLPHLWLMPGAVLLGALYLALQTWAVRRRSFGTIARSRVIQSGLAAGGQISLGVAGVAPLGLLIGQALNYGAGALTIGLSVLVEERVLLRRISLQGMRAAFVKHQRFPRYSIWEALANAAAINLPMLLIVSLAAGAEAGYLSLAIFLLQVPMALVGSAVGQVYLSGAPDAMRQDRLASYTAAAVSNIVKIAAPPLVIIACVSPFAFDLVFGEGWARSGLLVSWMAPWFLFQLVCSPISSVLHVTGRQSLAMGLQIAGLIVRTSAVLAAAAVAPAKIAEAFAVSGLVFYLPYAVICLNAAGVDLRDILRNLAASGKYLLVACIVGAGLAAAFRIMS